MNHEDSVRTFRAFLATYVDGDAEQYSDWNEWDIFPEFQQILKTFDDTFGATK